MTLACLLSLVLTGCVEGPSASHDDPKPPTTSDATVFAGTLSEWADAVVACLVTQGWDSVVMDPEGPEGPGNFSTSGVSPAQQDAYDKAQQDCFDSIGFVDTVPKTPEEARRIYDAFVDENNCLANAGFYTEEPPSFASYYAAFLDTGYLNWDPISLITSEYSAALAACPRPALF